MGGDGTAAYTWPYCSLYPYVLQLIPGGTAAYIVTCDFNENPKSDFDFDIGFVNIHRSLRRHSIEPIFIAIKCFNPFSTTFSYNFEDHRGGGRILHNLLPTQPSELVIANS